MNSSMSAGERRRPSARRGGMTILGKVAVPKPLNLPSQRLENHGLDPNVEIVPKGTLGWGGRPSSSTSNPWNSSSLSPNAADGGIVSPGHLSGVLSSGESGTRPSTAGSDRTHETVSNAWGSDSRPLSASGTLASNQTASASLRPKSAENRPNSSQLSRFAEPASKSSVVWGPSNAADKLVGKSSKENGFSLSSRDFPTLGSEKDTSLKNSESEDHGPDGRPSSASSRIAERKEDTNTKFEADLKHGMSTWSADGSQNAGDDGIPRSMEKWQGETHPYFNSAPVPQHFDTWRGPPVNGPTGVWYGGRPQPPAYGSVRPGGFPREPFPYYHSQILPPPLTASQQVVPPPGAGSRGLRPKNGDLYRPQVPDAYAHPGMPFRPGFYPGPPGPMGFEGFYRPPMGYSERDIPFMGMQPGPPVYNGYAGPPDIANSHGRPAGHTTFKPLSGPVEVDHLEDTQGPKRAHLKKHNKYDGQREEGENLDNTMQPSDSYPGKGRLLLISSQKNEWVTEEDADAAMFPKREAPTENYSHGYEHQVHAADSIKLRSNEGMGKVKPVNDNWTNKSEGRPYFPPEMQPPATEKDSSLPTVAKNVVLMHKIDGLNAKARLSDGRNLGSSAYNRDEENHKSPMLDIMTNNYIGASNTAECFERTPVVIPGDKAVQSMVAVSRRSYHGGPGRVDQRGKGKFDNQDTDGWQRKTLTNAVKASNIKSAPNIHARDPIVLETSENFPSVPVGKIEGDSVESHDSTDTQRSKMRELVKQRALQLQKEEEERTREQKAKALVKLEELNKRTLAGGAAKADQNQVTGDVQIKQGESPKHDELELTDLKFQVLSKPAFTSGDKDDTISVPAEFVELPKDLPLEMQQTCFLESNVYPSHIHEGTRDGNDKQVDSQFNDGGLFKHKQKGYKQKQNSQFQKNFNEKNASDVPSDVEKDHVSAGSIDVAPQEGHSSEIKQNDSVVPHISSVEVHQRRKNNRSSKNKHKQVETPANPSSSHVPSDVNTERESIKHDDSKGSSLNMDNSVVTMIEFDNDVQTQEIFSSLPNEESHGTVSNQWKRHPSRRLPRNQHTSRYMDKLHGSDTVVWAPVRMQSKTKGSDYASQNSAQESAISTKADNVAQNNSKGRRAEMVRYVPKPVAKELAQQGNLPAMPSSSSSSRSNEGSAKEQSATAHVVPSLEIDGDGNINKHRKDHGLWRQRGSTDLSHTKGATPAPEPTNGSQQSEELLQVVKIEMSSAIGEYKSRGRDKRLLHRGSRSTGSNLDPESVFDGEIDGTVQSALPDVSQTQRVTPKASQSFGDGTASQWQPKSQSNPVHNHHGNRIFECGPTAAEINKFPKDHPQNKAQVAPPRDEESGYDIRSGSRQFVNPRSKLTDSVVSHSQELVREKMPGSGKGGAYLPSQDTICSGEFAPASNTDQMERKIPHGSRKNPKQTNRSPRGPEPRGDWSGHDARPYRDRQRQNVHYEYQPVDFLKSSKPEKLEEQLDEGHRERAPNHSRHGGNIYKRQTGGVHINPRRD